MFSSIKNKILTITFSMLIALIIVLLGFTYVYYQNSKNILILSCSKEIRGFAEDINKKIAGIEIDTKDLALIGEIYAKIENKRNHAKNAILKLIANDDSTIGGGIWYTPYYIDKNKLRYCIYGLQHGKKVIIDNNFESEEYNYHNQNWYKEISSKVTPEHNIAWTLPYTDRAGSKTTIITAGSGIYDKNNVLIGLSTLDWKINDIISIVNDIKPTPNSFAVFADEINDYIIASTDPFLDNEKLLGKSLKEFSWYNKNLLNKSDLKYNGINYFSYVKKLDNGMILIVNVPQNEFFRNLKTQTTVLLLTILIISTGIAILLYTGLDSNILQPINKERKQINSELAVARTIQESSLPNIFPAYPERKDFEIFASMKTAKEVGGDFYDFYFVDKDNFMFLIADVSGKGIPAALFMMKSKTLINNLAKRGYDSKTLIKKVNKKICENNTSNNFITLFGATVNLKTGEMNCINCGHNPPLIKRGNENFEYLTIDSNIVLGAFPDAEFEIYQTNLKPNDVIFLYTDGITEALNSKNETFGEERLKSALNQNNSSEINKLTTNIRENLYKFTGSSAQSDDMTVLFFKYAGQTEVNTYKNKALLKNYKEFYTWLEDICKNYSINKELSNKIGMCAEEIFANVTFYAYPEKTGDIEVNFTKNKSKVTLEFIDEGIPYNPIEKPDPNINLPAKERTLGGLGIYMIKQLADNILYKREDNKNILILDFEL